MEDNAPIEQRFKLEKVESKKGKTVITQERKYIFYYKYTRKTDNSMLYNCSFYKDKEYPCKEYVVLNDNMTYNQNNYNFEHSGHDIKYDEIKTLFEKKKLIT